MALVRVYCGLASANPPQQLAVGSSSLSATVVDDSGRLLDVCDIGDDPYGYAYLSTLLAERASGPYSVALAADSDQRLVPALLATAGWAVAFVDSGATDDFAERFADDLAGGSDSAPMQRRALGLARALHAGALSATSTPAPAELAGLKPLLAAHGALATGRHAAAVALREVLRELYPAALRAYPDPADPVALAVMEALPEPGALTSSAAARGRDAAAAADAVTSKLAAAGLGDPAAVSEAITALRVAIAETPRRGGIGRDLTATVAETVRQAVSAVRSCDSASAALVRALAGRISNVPAAAADPAEEVGTRATASPIGHANASGYPSASPAGPAPVARPNSPIPTPLPPRMAPPPVPAAAPLSPPPQAVPPQAVPSPAPPPPEPAPQQQPAPQQPAAPPAPPQPGPPQPGPQQPAPQPPAMHPPLPPAASPPPAMPAPPAASPAPAEPPPMSPPPSSSPPRHAPPTATGGRPVSAPPPPPPGITPIGEPRSPIPPPRPRPPQEPSEPAPWRDDRVSLPTVGSATPPSAAPPSGGQRTGGGRRRAEDKAPANQQPSQITPPWRSEDLVPPEPPPLRLVEPLPNSGVPGNGYPDNSYPDNGYPDNSYPDNGYLENGYTDNGYSRNDIPHNGIPRSVPPVSADDDDNLLIFAQTRSAWFSGEDDAEWSSRMDAGWRAAEQAASKPAVGDRTGAGLPRRVPRANLVPGSPPTINRQLRVVRDPSSIAAHTSGYFNGWRRGQEVGGVGGYPLGNRQQSAGAWDFTRDVAQ